MQSEDCLSVNVWVKNSSNTAPKAVLVFYHGGSKLT